MFFSTNTVRKSLFVTVSLVLGDVVSGNYDRCLRLDELDPLADYFEDKVEPMYSDLWSIQYEKAYKILSIKTNKTDAAPKKFLLYQCGTDAPDVDRSEYDIFAEVPLQNGVILSSTTDIPHFFQLRVGSEIKAYYESNSSFNTSFASDCMDILVDSKLTERTSDLLSFREKNPGAVTFVHTVPSVLNGTLKNVFEVHDYQEETSRQINEWHKVFAVFFNKERLANKQFRKATKNFQCTADNAKFVSQIREPTQEKKIALWARYINYTSYYPIGLPHAGWQTATCDRDPDDNSTNYYCEYGDHCNVEFLHSNKGSLGNEEAYKKEKLMNDTEFAEFGKRADYWIYPDSKAIANTLLTEKEDILKEFKSVQDGTVFSVKRDGWFTDKFVEYATVLQDYCQIVEHIDLDSKLTWFENVYQNKTGVIKQPTCKTVDDLDKKWESRAVKCLPLGKANCKDNPVSYSNNKETRNCSWLNSKTQASRKKRCDKSKRLRKTCPETCKDKCVCGDKKKGSFTKSDGKKGRCSDVMKLESTGDVKKYCADNPNARVKCKDSCYGWCADENLVKS